MSCAEDSIQGLIQLEGIVTSDKLTAISTRSYPFVLSVSPRSVPPTLSGRWIEDTAGTSCTHQQLSYDLVDMHFCRASHPTFVVPNTTQKTSPIIDLTMTFIPRGTAFGAGYSAIIMFIPVFRASSASSARYHRYIDLIFGVGSSHQDPSAIPSIDSIFHEASTTQDTQDPQTCYAYTVCMPGEDFPRSIRCMVFPKGMVSASLPMDLENQTTDLPPYRLPSRVVHSWGFSSTSPVTLETKKATIQITSDAFSRRLEYFTKSPATPSNVSKAVVSTQYKCAPIDQMKEYLKAVEGDNFRQNSVILPGTTSLHEVLTERNVMQATQTKGDVQRVDGLTTGQIEGIIGATMAVVVVGIIALWVGKKATTNS